MILTTSVGPDKLRWDPVNDSFDTWQDAGGIDTLVVEAPFLQDGFRMKYDGQTLTARNGDAVLAMPGGTLNAPAIEMLTFETRLIDSSANLLETSDLRIVVDPASAFGADVAVIGGVGDDRIEASQFAPGTHARSVFFGNGGADEIILSPLQAAHAYGGGGDDTIRASGAQAANIYGEGGDDILRGADGDDILFGGGGKDVLRGGSGDDELNGDGLFFLPLGPFDVDRLYGGRGDDLLNGGIGRDRMTGGAGADTFMFLPGSGRDVITDFEADRDRIFFDSDTLPGVLKVRQVDKGTKVIFDFDDSFFSGDSATLVLLKGVQLTKSDIDFDTF